MYCVVPSQNFHNLATFPTQLYDIFRKGWQEPYLPWLREPSDFWPAQILATLLEKQSKFPRYKMKCTGKRDTTWTIPRSITISPLHFMLNRGKSITFKLLTGWDSGRSNQTEEKANFFAAACGVELIKYLAALAILHQDDLKKRMNRITANHPCY